MRRARICSVDGDESLHPQVVDGHVILAGRWGEFEHQMRGRCAGQPTGRSVLGVERGELPLQAGGDVAHLEQFPAIRVAGHGARHQHVDRPARVRGETVRQRDPHAEPDVGAIGPQPHRALEFVDHTGCSDRGLQSERRARGSLENDVLACNAPVGRFRIERVAEDSRRGIGVREAPDRVLAVETFLDIRGPGIGSRSHEDAAPRRHQDGQ